MIELPSAMGDHFRRGSHSKLFHVFIGKAVRQLVEWSETLKSLMYRLNNYTFGRYARCHAGNSDGLEESYFDMLQKNK